MGRMKALLEYQTETFLDRLIGLFARHCRSVTVVLGAHADSVIAGVARKRQAVFVQNANYLQGQLSSLQTGLRSMPSESHVLMTLVDHPAVRESTVEALLAEPSELAIARYREHNGHPILLSPAIAKELLALDPSQTPKDTLHSHYGHARFVDVDDPGVIQDIDDPAAYAELLGSAGAA